MSDTLHEAQPTPRSPASPIRVFLDSGVIIEGSYSAWGASKGVLILATQRRRDIRIVLAEAVEREVRRDLDDMAVTTDPARATIIIAGFEGWLARAQIERRAQPTEDEILAHYQQIMPALRHENDVAPVVTAILAQPNWVLSTNTKHWSPALGARTGLRIATPQQFLEQLII
ncbi:MAG TPA: hypothetical protein VMV29_08055 [Ktedonobacterales bacterium]|nr:hypothetical protein [Ktedonobacterales bacterium]